jgi:hypothetical protein
LLGQNGVELRVGGGGSVGLAPFVIRCAPASSSLLARQRRIANVSAS